MNRQCMVNFAVTTNNVQCSSITEHLYFVQGWCFWAQFDRLSEYLSDKDSENGFVVLKSPKDDQCAIQLSFWISFSGRFPVRKPKVSLV